MAVTVDSLEIQIQYAANDAASSIDKLTNSLKALRSALTTAKMKAFNQQMVNLAAGFKQLDNVDVDRIERISNALQGMSGLKGTLGITKSDVNGLQNVAEAAEKVSEATKDATKQTGGLSSVLKRIGIDTVKVGQNFKNATKGVRKFISAIGRIALYRLIRSALKKISEGFQEGLSNAYQFSTMVGFRLAEQMDKLSSASLKMKNQLGSLAAEVISALTPALLRLIGIVTKIANVFAQIVALLQGHTTYLKAKDVTEPWEEGTKAAKKYLSNLQGFDELNVIQSPTDSGGESGSGIGDMFEETDVSETIKKALEWVKEHLDLIKGLALAIGAAFLAWKIGKLFFSDLGKLFGICLAIGGLVALIYFAFDAWNNGLTFENLTGMLIGIVALVVGLGIAFGVTGAAIGLLIGGIALLVVGFREWIKTGELTDKTFAAIEIGIAAVGIAITLLGGWIVGVIAIIAMLVIAVIKNWDKIKSVLNKIWEKIKSISSKIWNSIKAMLNNIIAGVEGMINKVVDGLNAILAPLRKGGKALADLLGIKNFEWNEFNKVSLGRLSTTNQGGGHAFANGGFPSKGEFFIARESGPEMVGSINGRTAVANNDQITSAIASACYSAMSQALAENGGSIRIEGDPNGMFRVVQEKANQYTRRTGQPAFS